MSHDDFAAEIDPTQPGQLPKGERILWQGRPDSLDLVWRVYHLREVSAYFGILMLWRGFSAWWETGQFNQVASAVSPLLLPTLLCAAILVMIGWLSARSTQYTLTDRRLVLEIGVALPTTFNLPFSSIGAAELRETGRGCGDIGVKLASEDKLAYLMLWPHARPWRLLKPEPMLRSVPDAIDVANLLGSSLRAAAGQPAMSKHEPAIAGVSNNDARHQELDPMGTMTSVRC